MGELVSCSWYLFGFCDLYEIDIPKPHLTSLVYRFVFNTFRSRSTVCRSWNCSRFTALLILWFLPTERLFAEFLSQVLPKPVLCEWYLMRVMYQKKSLQSITITHRLCVRAHLPKLRVGMGMLHSRLKVIVDSRIIGFL